MNSCCRTAALRIFVRNITQIHFPPPTSAYRIPRHHSALTQFPTLQHTAALLSGARGRLLHTSCAEGREDGGWPPPAGMPPYQEPSPPKLVLEATNKLSLEPTEVAVDTKTPPQNNAISAKQPGGAQPGPLRKWAQKKLKKSQEAAPNKQDGDGDTSVVENVEDNITVALGKGYNRILPLNPAHTNKVPGKRPTEKQDKAEIKRPRLPHKKESKGAKFKRLKKEREERRRHKLEILESGEQEGTVSMNKAELKRALHEKKLREEGKQARAQEKALERDAALAEKLERKAELKAARKERRRQEFEEEMKVGEEPRSDKRGMEEWRIQKQVLKEKFPEGWMPRKRLSPDALAGIKALNAQFPEQYTTAKLAEKFEVSPEAIRRILKSNWAPNVEEEEERQGRWFNRGKRVWAHLAELGMKPPAKWRAEGVVRDPKWNRGRRRHKPSTGDFLG
ncbi:hypothetical protein B0T21DRAFT_354418 [Apiosordaria backusii]|uniref:Required for respiratory growth protein 9, mitochondrial n=1 Tax=Apiosordaria backusii TaxID=314023 RepID=A0AA40EXQ4_9PEZI|nr:hypothetical protein B0T21DRAFT_354418 [Apiosordaria backusii]